MTQTLRIEMVEKVSTNKIYSGIHWTKRKATKDTYYWEVRSKVKSLFPVTGPVDLKMTFWFKGKPLDSSNCSYMAKCIEDSIVKCKILEDDSYKHVLSVQYLSLRDPEKKKEYIDIEIKER